jgi:hypothetical protein
MCGRKTATPMPCRCRVSSRFTLTRRQALRMFHSARVHGREVSSCWLNRSFGTPAYQFDSWRFPTADRPVETHRHNLEIGRRVFMPPRGASRLNLGPGTHKLQLLFATKSICRTIRPSYRSRSTWSWRPIAGPADAALRSTGIAGQKGASLAQRRDVTMGELPGTPLFPPARPWLVAHWQSAPMYRELRK